MSWAGSWTPLTMGRSSFSVSSSSSMPYSKHRSSNSSVVYLVFAVDSQYTSLGRGHGGGFKEGQISPTVQRVEGDTHCLPRASKSLYLSTEMVGIVKRGGALEAAFFVLRLVAWRLLRMRMFGGLGAAGGVTFFSLVGE